MSEFSGIWHNKYGSEIKLEIDEQGRVIGGFRTAVGRAETKHIWKDRWFEVVGFSNGNLISLVVNYGPDVHGMSVISGKLVTDESGAKNVETLSYTRFSLPEEEQWRETNAAALTYFSGSSSKK
jgi:hypothetical protein